MENLFTAARDNNVAQIRELMAIGGPNGDVSARNIGNSTPLHVAVLHGSIDALNELLLAGADALIKGNGDNTPLHLAVVNDNIGAVIVLLTARANVLVNGNIDAVHAKNNYGSTPLHLAASHGNIDVVRMLLRAGANISTKDISGNRPVDTTDDQEIINLIESYEHKVDVKEPDCI